MISEEQRIFAEKERRKTYEDTRKPPPWAPIPPRRARISPELCGAVILIGIITLVAGALIWIF